MTYEEMIKEAFKGSKSGIEPGRIRKLSEWFLRGKKTGPKGEGKRSVAAPIMASTAAGMTVAHATSPKDEKSRPQGYYGGGGYGH